jgi:hypothetical protein
MTRIPKSDLFASSQERQALPQEPPARRSVLLESLLCIAIRRRVLVTLLYRGDFQERLFEPTVVYFSSEHRLCVSGLEIADPKMPLNNLQMHSFEVGEINRVSLTEQTFVIDPVLDRFDDKYANGIICSTY